MFFKYLYVISNQGKIETWNECKEVQTYSHMKWKCAKVQGSHSQVELPF
jgi:hypothetical protein